MSAGRRKGKLVLIWGVLVVLVGIIYAVDHRDDREEQAQAEIESRGEDRDRNVIPIPIEQVGALEVAHAGALHRFERDAEGVWLYHSAHAPVDGAHGHQADPALADVIRTKLLGFARAHRERTIPYDPKTQDYGLANPQTLLLVYRKGETQPLTQFAFGESAPDGLSRYVLEMGAPNVFTLANFQYENLVSLVDAVMKATAITPGTPPVGAPGPAQNESPAPPR
jgi:hypothetical protein